MSAQEIWNALLANGASSVQAAGIMGNMFFESGLNPEASAIDSNGLRSVGLAQWNAGSYPNAGSLVTGNPAADIIAQVKYLAQTGGFKAASGSSPTEAGRNFAANYERCQTCQGGGSQQTQRAAKAAEFFNASKTGQWPQSAGTDNGGGGGGGGGFGPDISAKLDPTCLFGIPSVSTSFGLGPFSIGGPSTPTFCFVSKVMARQVVGGLLIAAGMLGALVSLAVIYKGESARAAAGNLWQGAKPVAQPVAPDETTTSQKTNAAVLPGVKPQKPSGQDNAAAVSALRAKGEKLAPRVNASKALSLGELPEALAVAV